MVGALLWQQQSQSVKRQTRITATRRNERFISTACCRRRHDTRNENLHLLVGAVFDGWAVC
jgi:hypothetical protein